MSWCPECGRDHFGSCSRRFGLSPLSLPKSPIYDSNRFMVGGRDMTGRLHMRDVCSPLHGGFTIGQTGIVCDRFGGITGHTLGPLGGLR